MFRTILLAAVIWIGSGTDAEIARVVPSAEGHGVATAALCEPGMASHAVLSAAAARDQARLRQLFAMAGVLRYRLPYSPERMLALASIARRAGVRQAEIALLTRAASGGSLQQVAQVELAELIRAEEPNRALELVLPVLQRSATPQLREAAIDTAVAVLEGEQVVAEALRQQLERARSRLPRSSRRRLELPLALRDTERQTTRLLHLLQSSHRDLVALAAARALSSPQLAGRHDNAEERWSVAQALYGNALYSEAEPLLESLLGTSDRSIPAWEVRFLRGRCAFRRGRWQEATDWYLRALAKTGDHQPKRRASLEVHLGRALELEGDLNEATDAARRAVIAGTSDDRRLFLARLRLRRGQQHLAAAGISRLKGRSNRARGQLMLALDDIRRGDHRRALNRLHDIHRRPWTEPAHLLAAELLLRAEDWPAARAQLEEIAPELDSYWGEQARRLMTQLPLPEQQRSERRRSEELRLAPGWQRSRALARWSVLDHTAPQLAQLRQVVAGETGLAGGTATPPGFPQRMAAELWQLGLKKWAARWDPDGFPHTGAPELVWTAARFAELGEARNAIRTADAAWRAAGSRISIRAYPRDLRRTLYPLPYSELVRRCARQTGTPWQLLAGVVREESRWSPDVLSVVGARGLTQLMPATAAGVARALGERPPEPQDLFRPEVGLRLGAIELGRLLSLFDGRWAPAVAAYNAGSAQATIWLDQCGAEYNEARYLLGISFGVTRRYTTEVLASARLYAELYGDGDSQRESRDESITAVSSSPS